MTRPDTRIIINFYSKLWELPLKTVKFLGLSNPILEQNWLTKEDIINLLHLTDFDPVKHWAEILWPANTPLIANVWNRYLAKIWPFKYFALTNFIVARPQAVPEKTSPSVSIIVPARNEAGNIAEIIERTPEMGSMTEIIFVEGHSSDDTFATIKNVVPHYPQRNIKFFQQTGKGKGDAVRLGFSEARGEILMILDADMTVPPENLPRFFEAIKSGKGEFINGVRLVYPMDVEAMRFFNLLGNKFPRGRQPLCIGIAVGGIICNQVADDGLHPVRQFLPLLDRIADIFPVYLDTAFAHQIRDLNNTANLVGQLISAFMYNLSSHNPINSLRNQHVCLIFFAAAYCIRFTNRCQTTALCQG